jgi:hypothetical protein
MRGRETAEEGKEPEILSEGHTSFPGHFSEPCRLKIPWWAGELQCGLLVVFVVALVGAESERKERQWLPSLNSIGTHSSFCSLINH